MLLFFKFVGKLLEKMLLTTKVLWNNADNIDVTVKAVGF